MAGVKSGDRVLFAGTEDIGLITEIGVHAGLGGRVVAIAATADAAQKRARRIELAGALVEPEHGPLTMLPLDSGSFDVAIAEDTLLALDPGDRRGAIGELFRVLRPGGRLIWIERQPRGGLFRLAPDSRALPDSAEREAALSAAGFRGVRRLASASRRVYIEGIKSAG